MNGQVMTHGWRNGNGGESTIALRSVETKRPLYFLFPHMEMRTGGNIAQRNFLNACEMNRVAEAITYIKRTEKVRHLDDLLINGEMPREPIYIVHWGPDVPWLLKRLKLQDVVYFAHSTGWEIKPSSRVPIVAVSRHSMGYWGRRAPNSAIYFVPNILGSSFLSEGNDGDRDIDVLVQKRKTSPYVLDALVPKLRSRCNVVVLEDWVDDLSTMLRRSKVYLYDSVDHWAKAGVSEGFGLPPLEALACGCVVFSSVNDALADYLTPGQNSFKLRTYSTSYDVCRIITAVRDFNCATPNLDWFEQYSSASVSLCLESVFADIESRFEYAASSEADFGDCRHLRPGARIGAWIWRTLRRLKNTQRILFRDA